MASLFTITEASPSVALSADRRGETSLTAFNASGRTIRGRASLVAAAPASAEWFTIVGEPEREFAAAAAEQYRVQIAVPEAVTAGTYSFRLDMVEVENPDENYSQGPTVTLEVQPAKPPPKPFPWWIVAAVAGILVVAAIVAFAVSSGAKRRSANATATAEAALTLTAEALATSQAGTSATETALALLASEQTAATAQAAATQTAQAAQSAAQQTALAQQSAARQTQTAQAAAAQTAQHVSATNTAQAQQSANRTATAQAAISAADRYKGSWTNQDADAATTAIGISRSGDQMTVKVSGKVVDIVTGSGQWQPARDAGQHLRCAGLVG